MIPSKSNEQSPLWQKRLFNINDLMGAAVLRKSFLIGTDLRFNTWRPDLIVLYPKVPSSPLFYLPLHLSSALMAIGIDAVSIVSLFTECILYGFFVFLFSVSVSTCVGKVIFGWLN